MNSVFWRFAGDGQPTSPTPCASSCGVANGEGELKDRRRIAVIEVGRCVAALMGCVGWGGMVELAIGRGAFMWCYSGCLASLWWFLIQFLSTNNAKCPSGCLSFSGAGF